MSPVPFDTDQRISAVRKQFDALGAYLDPEALAAEVADLEGKMGAAGFWNDQEEATKVSSRHSAVNKRLETYRSVSGDIGDLDSLVELVEEDDDLADELTEQLSSLEARLGDLEEERLFSGQYDAGDALITVNAGTGGTDAQDWAEMVLRMMMRWGESRKFKTELLEVSEGEEAGIRSATFRAEGENAYGLYSAEKGVHRLVRISKFDSQGRRQTAFAGVEVAPILEDVGDVEIDSDDLQVDTYRASGAGGQHVNKTDSAVRITHRPSGIVVQCQNERSQTQNRLTAMGMLRAKLIEKEERERKAELDKEKGGVQDVNFGSQIRSYVLHPYTMVKDHRTGVEAGDAQRILDGDLDAFVRAELERQVTGAAPLRDES
ncbi:MAG: peptide chain release factor 2 [Solirubrobacteraceae bacterium]|nr:peptide chain release factor 2 [Solirubrobacteraceae bacterium]